MGQYVLAIDQGTTSTKALVVDAAGEIRGASMVEFAQIFPQPGWVEHDPEDIWSSVSAATGAALDSARVDRNDVSVVGITNQRETAVLWDRASGLPVHNAIVWQDRRTALECEQLRARDVGAFVASRSGLRIDPYFSATKIAWMLDHVDGLRARAERGEIAFGTIDSWLLWKLTDGRVHATDATNASRTSLMDLRSVSWDEELCRLFNVPLEVLPRIERSESVFGETRLAGLSASLPIGALVGDQQAALLAQGCTRRGQTKNTYGTGSFVLQHTGDVALADTGSLVATAACTGPGEPFQYALEGSIFVTGASIQWLRDGLGIIDSAQDTEAMARDLKDNGDVWFVPALTGLGAPQWDPHARGVIIGITRGTTTSHLVRAALESIAFHTRDVIDVMNARSGYALEELRVDGGASANRWLMQFQCDILGVPVEVAATTEATALGAAFAAGISAGVWSSHLELPRLTGRRERYEPSMSVDQREALHQRWTQALAKARDWAQ